MSLNRFYKEDKSLQDFSIDNTYVQVDSGDWRKPYIISIENIGNKISLKLNKDLSGLNVTSSKFEDQNLVVNRSPESLPITNKAFLAVDDNYLYVWIENLGRWKRVALTEW